MFLPDQGLDLDELERVTDLLGGRDVTPFVDPLEDRPYVIRVIKEPTDVFNFANAWHSDLSYLPAPPAYTLLHAWDVPTTAATRVWSNQYLAYETLSGGLRATLDGLERGPLGRHGLRHRRAAGPGQGPDVHGHRAVARRLRRARPPGRDRPSGDRSAGPLREPGLHHALRGVDEGGVPARCSTHLYRHSINENFTCRLRWSVHTLAIWDNRCTMHNALNDYSGVRREMYRTSVKGAAPAGLH